jgi:hypothetical protein
MQRGPALIGVAGLIVIVALFLVLRGGDDDDSTTTAAPATTQPATTTTGETTRDTTREEPKPEPKPDKPEVATIVIKNGQPEGGVQELEFTEGDDIRFRVESDVTDHVHLHGYDVFEDVEAGGSVSFDVPATIPGVFEAELEDRVVPIAEITVNPS